MEGGKKPSYSIADGAFPTGKGALAPATADPSSTSSPPSPGYFSSVFPPAPAAMGKDSVGSDLYWTLNRQRTSGRIGDAKGAAPGGRSQSSPIKKQTTQSKDGTPVDPIQSEESVYFSSSVHYGGRDFYDSSASSQVPGNPKTMTKRKIQVTPTLPTEVNGGKVPFTTDATSACKHSGVLERC